MIVEHDIVVIGAGIAGASVAAHLSAHVSVRVLEMEHQPGYHSTGRSAALFSETYGNDVIRALTRASRQFFHSPPPAFCTGLLVKPRDVLTIARTGQAAALDAFVASAMPTDAVELKSVDEALALCPILRREGLVAAALSHSSADIDVHELHRGYLRLLKARQGVLTTQARVIALQRDGDRWMITTALDTFRARTVVNAAGAWAEEIGRLAGARGIALRPLRRTACLVAPPAGQSTDRWPMLLDVDEQFYLKPDAGMLLLSPADETATEPCDALPDDWDIAVLVDRIERATTLDVKRIAHKWAGLRSFVEDRSPVVGYDPDRGGFFWLAAVGGFGIQTAPALSRLAASLVLDSAIDADLLDHGVAVAALSPSRLRSGCTATCIDAGMT